MTNRTDTRRQQILDLTAQYSAEAFPAMVFRPGGTPVPVSGKEIDGADMSAVVNSGASANLLAVSALALPKLAGRRLKPGDEVITVATVFPTTLNPILQNRFVPVIVDVTLRTFEIDVSRLEAALGNVFDLDAGAAFVKKHNRWLLEDCCDAWDPPGTVGMRARSEMSPRCPLPVPKRKRAGPAFFSAATSSASLHTKAGYCRGDDPGLRVQGPDSAGEFLMQERRHS